MTKYPYLLLNKEVCVRNIEKMANKAKKHNLNFRPHFKTHQSLEVAEWYKKYGINCCTVSSFEMAKYFASGGWNDITVAFPVSVYDINSINSLAKKVNIQITTSSYKNFNSFCEAKLESKIGIFIEVDCGHNRSGVNIDNTREIALIINLIEQNNMLNFKGFITHAGHTYTAKTAKEVEALHRKALAKLSQLKTFWKETFPELIVSYGDTPSCSVSDDFWGIDEIRPGNFVFYDLTQASIGSCKIENIAMALICPVVDVYPERGEAIIHAGAVHLSKDSFIDDEKNKSFGSVCQFNGKNWELPSGNLYLKSLSQEHGVVTSKNTEDLNLKVGQLVAILPVHSCLTLDSMGEIYLENMEKIGTMRQRK